MSWNSIFDVRLGFDKSFAFRSTKVAIAPVYGGLPVALHSHLYTTVHRCRGDPNIVHHLVYNTINTRLQTSNNILEAVVMWFEEETSGDQIRF